MKLYGSLTSPFARKCRITALEAGLDAQVEFVTVVVMDLNAVQPNPLKFVPSLETDGGELIVDSRVICDYLHQAGKLATSKSDWQDKTLVAIADGLMDRAVAMALESRRPENEQSESWQARRRGAIEATLATLEPLLPQAFTPGAIALTCALSYIDFRHPSLDWRSDHQPLADWFTLQSQRPSVKSTEPPA